MYSERVEGCPYTKAYTKNEVGRLLARDFNLLTTAHFDVIDTLRQRKVKLQLPDDHQLGWHLIVRGKKRVRRARKSIRGTRTR